MGVTDLSRHYVVKVKSGRYIDNAGEMTWARSMARIFTEEDLAAYRAGWSMVIEAEDWIAIEVDARGVALSRREPVTG